MRRLLKAHLFMVLAMPQLALAQSAAVQKAAKSVFALTTYKADGSILATSHGVYCAGTGEAISAFAPFVGASSASVIDASGKRSDVVAIIGANEIYDICRFRVSSNTAPLPQAQPVATGRVWVAGYSTKKVDIRPLTIRNSETFLEKYNYYTFNEEITEDIEGCPILNDAGEVLGLVQRSSKTYDIHSTDSRYYSDLTTTGLSLADATLNRTNIRKALPSDREQARLMLLMIDSKNDSTHVANLTRDYIQQYPADIDGYSAMARYEVAHGNLAKASELMKAAIKKSEPRDEAYYEYAKLIYGTVVYSTDSLHEWTLGLAEENVKAAISLNDQPVYRHLLAQLTYAKGDFETALQMLEALTETDIASSEIHYEVAQSKTMLDRSDEEVLESLDKAVEAAQPMTYAEAPYLLARGVQLDNMGEYRKALQDYNLYDSLMLYRSADDFYYTRYKCEVKVRQYKQALNDIAHAAFLNPGEATYLAELASLQLHLGSYEDAVKTCDISMRITTEYPDIYIVKGLALHQLGRGEESTEAFLKAKELGDERADAYLEKYK